MHMRNAAWTIEPADRLWVSVVTCMRKAAKDQPQEQPALESARCMQMGCVENVDPAIRQPPGHLSFQKKSSLKCWERV